MSEGLFQGEKPGKIKVLIADDEQPARERLVRMLEVFPDVAIIGEAATGMEAIMLSKEMEPHVIFLDIQMPPPTGLEAARQILEQQHPPLVVFVTAYNEYAVDAFELKASDYLVKPVQMDRIAKTMERIREGLGSPGRWQNLLVDMVKRLTPQDKIFDRIAVLDKEKGTRKIVDLNEVLWFMAKDDKCFAHLKEGAFGVSQTITQLTALLPDNQFFRTHRAYLVNLKHIKEVAPWFHGAYNVIMQNGEEVPLSRNCVQEFKQKVGWL